MRSLTIFLATSALALAACRSGTHGPSTFQGEDGAGSPVVVDAAGNARAITSEDVEQRFQPALQALERAVASGDDLSARAVLQTLMALGPTGGALDLARGYEKILDGRAAIAMLSLRLDGTYEPSDTGPGIAVVSFVSRTQDGRALRVTPGPATLHVTLASTDAAGDQTASIEALPLDAIGVFEATGEEKRTPVARFPVMLPKGAIALRITCDLELRSGSVRDGERDLPAMRMRVASGEVVLLSAELSAQGLSAPADLAAHVENGGGSARAALQIAVRLPRADREAALVELARISEDLPRPSIQLLTPALRWIAPETKLGADVDAWRAYLRGHARTSAPTDTLRLPRKKITDDSGA